MLRIISSPNNPGGGGYWKKNAAQVVLFQSRTNPKMNIHARHIGIQSFVDVIGLGSMGTSRSKVWLISNQIFSFVGFPLVWIVSSVSNDNVYTTQISKVTTNGYRKQIYTHTHTRARTRHYLLQLIICFLHWLLINFDTLWPITYSFILNAVQTI